jgi:pilus assembly protein CpaB
MRMSTLVTLLVVGGSGLAAFILAYGYLGNQQDPNKGKVPVLSATQPLKRGDIVELGKNAEFKMVAEADIPEEALVDDPKLQQELQGKKVLAMQAIGRNDILKKNTAGSNMSGLIEARLRDKPGFRAIAMSVTTDKSVAGFIKPGSYVDLIWTGQVKGGKELTKSLMANVEVAAVDLENTVAASAQAMGKEVRYLTFIVSAQDVQTLAFAKEHGSVTAALRGTAQDLVGAKPLQDTDWGSFLGEKSKKGESAESEVSNADRKSLETEGLALVDMIESALAQSAAASATPKHLAPITAVSSKGPRKLWYMFEVKNVDGKTLTRVPVAGESEFARKNKHLLRAPEPDELEAINKMATQQVGPTEGQ